MNESWASYLQGGYLKKLSINDVASFPHTQKKRMTSVIFKDEAVLSQLQQAQKDRESAISTYSDNEEEFAQLLKEIRND